MRGTSLATWAALCLAVTLPRVGWAEDSLAAGAAAYAPHHTWGPTVRVGTTVGPVYGRRLDAQAVGGTVAAGQRLGRVTLEVELAYLAFQELGPSSLALGEALRLGGIVRADVLRVGSAWVGPNSMLALTTEVGAARQHDTWYPATANEVPRVVLDGGTHSEAHVGVGVMIDHRFERRFGPGQVGEDRDVLERVVLGDRPAVARAEGTQRPVVLPHRHLVELVPGLAGRQVAVAHL